MAIGIDASKIAKTFDLASLKSDADELGIDKFKTTSVSCFKQTKLVKNDALLKRLYMMNWLKKGYGYW